MFNTEIIRYEFDDFDLDVKKEKLLMEGKEVSLPYKAFKVLHILVQNAGQVVEKKQIIKELWIDSFVEEANLTQYVYLLRKALDKNLSGNSYIETINKIGYKFNVDVKEIYLDKQTQNKNLPLTDLENRKLQKRYEYPEPNYANVIKNSIIENPNNEKEVNSNLYQRLSITLSSLIILSLSIIGFLIYNLQLKQKNSENNIKSIAVLPFKSIGSKSESEKIGLGMSDAVITRLSKLQQIPVLPVSSVFHYADETDVNPLSAGDELGVDMVLSGTIQRAGKKIRITVQLINIADGKPLWAEKFDENYTSIFEVQDSISLRVAQSLTKSLTNNQKKLLAKHPTDNLEALQAYQLGVYLWNKRTKTTLEKGIEYFNKAIELDPNYAQAYAMLADSYLMLGYYRYADLKQMLKKAKPIAEKSLVLNSLLPEGYIVLGSILFLEPQGLKKSKKYLEKAIELAPYNSVARIRHSWWLLRDRNLDEAVREMRLAQQYDPLSPISNSALCSMLLFQQNFEESVNFCEKAVDLASNNALTRRNLAKSYFFADRFEKAILQAKTQIKSGTQSNHALLELGFFYAKLDRRTEALKIVSKLESEVEKDSYLLLGLTTINYALGDTDKAFIYFNKSIEEKVLTFTLFYYDPIWKSIRLDSRFIKAFLIKHK